MNYAIKISQFITPSVLQSLFARYIVRSLIRGRHYSSRYTGVGGAPVQRPGPAGQQRCHRTAMSAMATFQGQPDRYGGLVVDLRHETVLQDNGFEQLLKASLEKWTAEGIRGVWFRVDIGHSEVVPILVKHEFVYHHARREFVMLVRWLPRHETDQIPPYAHTMVGVGGMVISEDQSEVLVVREKYYKHPHWKLPGGFVEPGEDLAAAAAREVLEETGVRAEFDSLLGFRHMHGSAYGCSDFYFICVLRPLSKQIQMCTRELTDCRWMPIAEYANHAEVHALNKLYIAKYLEFRRHRAGMQLEQMRIPGINRLQNVFTLSMASDGDEGEAAGGVAV